MESQLYSDKITQMKTKETWTRTLFRQDYANENEGNMEYHPYSDKIIPMKTKLTWNNNHIQTRLHQ